MCHEGIFSINFFHFYYQSLCLYCALIHNEQSLALVVNWLISITILRRDVFKRVEGQHRSAPVNYYRWVQPLFAIHSRNWYVCTSTKHQWNGSMNVWKCEYLPINARQSIGGGIVILGNSSDVRQTIGVWQLTSGDLLMCVVVLSCHLQTSCFVNE